MFQRQVEYMQTTLCVLGCPSRSRVRLSEGFLGMERTLLQAMFVVLWNYMQTEVETEMTSVVVRMR